LYSALSAKKPCVAVTDSSQMLCVPKVLLIVMCDEYVLYRGKLKVTARLEESHFGFEPQSYQPRTVTKYQLVARNIF
jgi:hypothetical protein